MDAIEILNCFLSHLSHDEALHLYLFAFVDLIGASPAMNLYFIFNKVDKATKQNVSNKLQLKISVTLSLSLSILNVIKWFTLN